MTPFARFQGAIELLDIFLNETRPADGLASKYFRDRRFIGSSDRKWIHNRFYAVLRHYNRLVWWHEKFGYSPSARSMVFADSVLRGEHDTKSLSEHICTGEKFAPEKLTASEEKLLEALKGQALEPDEMDDKTRLECPEWAWGPLVNAFGLDKAKAVLAAMQKKNDLHLRVNTLHTTRDKALAALKKDGFEASAGPWSPWAIRLSGRPQITQHELMKSGHIEIQNEGSQLIAQACNAAPGMRVVDFCAGAGGKTLALAAMMDNKGSIVACDVLEGRLRRSKKRFQRAGVHNIETRALSSERDKWVKRHKGKYDIVLVDAPCSGLGTWRGDPDKRIRQLGPGLVELVPLQKEILDSAARLVKPGGRLVYATCSLLPVENEKQIEGFLSTHSDFKKSALPDVMNNEVIEDGYMKANPADHDCDGFFAAVMERSAADADKSE